MPITVSKPNSDAPYNARPPQQLESAPVTGFTPSCPASDTLHATKRYSFIELADYTIALAFDPEQLRRPTAIAGIEFREPTGRDLFELSNVAGSNVEKAGFILKRLATRAVLSDGTELVDGDAIYAALEGAPAWQATAAMSIAKFLDLGDDDEPIDADEASA